MAVQGMVQVCPQHLFFRRQLIHLLRKKLVVVASGSLGLVHRDIAVFEQRLRVGPIVREHGDADTGADVQLLLLELVRQQQGVQQLLRHRSGILGAGDAVQ